MDVVETIKRQVELVEYIGRSTPLQKSGKSFKGLCPFHTEKTPSFYVFPERGNWRCFGSCGDGGDLFSFVEKKEQTDFRGALRLLAAEAGVQLTAENPRKRTLHDRLAATMSAAVEYYQQRLAGPEGAAARDYLLSARGLERRTIETWRLGWAPDGWRGLRDYMHGRGYEDADLLGAGLVVEGEGGREPYDRFRGRVIIPIANERGEYVAMGGRGLQGEQPKYLNSPQTELFDKGNTLFGLSLAGAAIRAAGVAVVVEGYMDVLGPWQAGFENVVATMGTSLTSNHASLLRRYARRVVLAMDPDAAGLNAAERAGELFLGLASGEQMAQAVRSSDAIAGGQEMEIRVAPLPPGRDPDEIAREDPEKWRDAITHALPFPEFLLKRLMDAHPVSSPLEAREAVDRMRPVLLAVKDPVERGMYVQRIARHLGITESAVLDRIRALSPRAPARPQPRREQEPLSPEDVLLALLLRTPRLRREFRNYPASLFSGSLQRELFMRWLGEEDFLYAAAEDDPVGERARLLMERRLPPLSEDEARLATKEKIREILRDRIILHQAARSEELADAERRLGANRVAEVALATWRGALPADHDRQLAEAVIEELQLGLSIHRQDGPIAT